MQPAPSKLQPALLGGVFMGVLSALPFISLGNCCCLWIIGGGVVATYLLQQSHPYPVTAADGALVGLMAGLIGGVIAALVSIPINMLMGPYMLQFMERMIASNPEVPEESKTMIRDMMARSGGFTVIGTLISMVLYAVVGAIISMLGGLLGVALFKKKDLPPPGTTEVLPPA